MRDRSGKYLLTTRLGTGGMGQVWAAIKEGEDGLRMPCAVKVLHPALAMTAEDRERFFGEARIAAQLDHGRIVKVIDTSEVQGSPCLVMEWVDGVDLRELIDRAKAAGNPRLGVDIALYVVGEILSAVEYAHGRTVAGEHAGVVHYDIKPSNILISSSGEVRLTDFGIAHFARTADSTMSRAMGTPRYMSPEQMSGRVRLATDIYSLGVVLHELLEGERYLAGTTTDAFQAAVLSGQVPDLTQADVPSWVDQLRRRMLQKLPADRPSAGDAHWMIIQHASRYSIAARELRVLYHRLIGKPKSGFTQLMELRRDPEFETALRREPEADPPAPEPPPRPADLARKPAAPELALAAHAGDHVTADHTNTGAPAAETEADLDATEVLGATDSGALVAPSPSAPPPTRPLLRWVAFAIMVSGLSVGVFGLVLHFTLSRPDAPEPRSTVVGQASEVQTSEAEVAVETSEDPDHADAIEASADAARGDADEARGAPPPVAIPDAHPAAEQAEPEPETETTPEPETATAETEAPAPPKPEPKPKAKPAPKVEVSFIIANVSSAELKVGSRTVDYRSFAMLELRPGNYTVKWRKPGSQVWAEAGKLRIPKTVDADASFYQVRLTATTLVATKKPKGSAK